MRQFFCCEPELVPEEPLELLPPLVPLEPEVPELVPVPLELPELVPLDVPEPLLELGAPTALFVLVRLPLLFMLRLLLG